MKTVKVKPTVEQLLELTDLVEKRKAFFACQVAKISFRNFMMVLNEGAELKEQQLLKLLRYTKTIKE
jgi:hypothetical protein